ncbi:hypothetical protein ACHQM5_017183 [Ranunculus cassubicifolius]
MSLKRTVSCVILDLDGTLLNTDAIIDDVLKELLAKYGKTWDGTGANNIVGMSSLEAATAIVQGCELPRTPEEFLSETTPLFSDPNRWCNIKALPGANRLITHLRRHGIPMALASNSSRSAVDTKISKHQGWKESFASIVGVDEVNLGKPSPEIYLESAKRLKVDTSRCLVMEDSLPGVAAAKAAGMSVIAIPSLPKQSNLFDSADEVINSLLDFHPENWGLPQFNDWIEGTLLIEPWYVGGPVIKGHGRGSKVLGIPTANLSTQGYSTLLSEYPSGVYFGWAQLSNHTVYKMVTSVGWNPYFDNAEKTIEPWLLHQFDEDFYGEELRLAIVGYIRPETNFPSLERLIERIHEDRRIAEKALELPIYSHYKNALYLPTLEDEHHF